VICVIDLQFGWGHRAERPTVQPGLIQSEQL
jgi:hypothetical protein